MNKFLSIIILSSFFLMACNSNQTAEPTDLDGKKKLLKQQKSELASLQESIDKLTTEIEALEPAKVKKKVLVTLDTIKPTNFKQFVEVQGLVVAEDYVNASSETGGRLTSLQVKEGDYVNKGKLIGTVDLESMEKQLDELNIAYDLANTVFERQKRLWDQNIGSEMQYLEAKNNKERLEKNIQTIKVNLSKKNIYAPIAGFIDREFIQAGEMTAPGTPIVSILNTSKVKVAADLPEKYLGTVKKGDKVTVEFPALQMTTESNITLLGRSIDPSNRTFKVEIAANNRNGNLKPNLLAKVLLNNYSNDEAITVSSDLVLKDVAQNQFIYVAEKKNDQYFSKQVFVKTGESYDNHIEILEGLSKNDLIVIDGARSLVDGTQLTIATAK